MMLLRIGLVVACSLAGFGCDQVGGPRRASDIQNLNAINDDISATRMTDSDSRMPHDPNARSTLPKTYEIRSRE
jgi:hypothetical protein